ncbi:MAG: GIY-YIG nuclease family protein [Planctomycetota bacterium]|nr:MAG: GIY-YIG nuclease family protein [Planctomycetota bacterium]
MTWTLYLLRSPRLGSTYAGISTDPARRLQQHNGELPGGAKSTRAGRPWQIIATWGPFADRGRAQRAEYGLKRLPGKARASYACDATSD